ncbi:MAG: Zn-ribbon domain-containing OB-fold protein [Betaproteobacteria bacterium]|nr:MAG: Zn-ribbon domain-containing OB-fold protein [Betaproteobacteria bacterium]
MTTAEERTIASPPVNPENERYFQAAKEGVLLVGKCNDCSEYHFYPRLICPHCNSDRTDWVPAKGTGVIYSYSTMRRGVRVPYTIAYVTLDEGVSMMTNIIDCDPDSLKIGDKVKLVFKSAEDGTAIPMFTPAKG